MGIKKSHKNEDENFHRLQFEFIGHYTYHSFYEDLHHKLVLQRSDRCGFDGIDRFTGFNIEDQFFL